MNVVGLNTAETIHLVTMYTVDKEQEKLCCHGNQ